MISKTKINQRMKRKTSPELAEAIFLAKKKNLVEIAREISIPARQQAKVNIDKINKAKGDILIIPGKVLSLGKVDKKKTIYALGFSEKAKEKLMKAGCKIDTILNALKDNTELKGEILR